MFGDPKVIQLECGTCHAPWTEGHECRQDPAIAALRSALERAEEFNEYCIRDADRLEEELAKARESIKRREADIESYKATIKKLST